jgi:chromosome segregation ATPase
LKGLILGGFLGLVLLMLVACIAYLGRQYAQGMKENEALEESLLHSRDNCEYLTLDGQAKGRRLEVLHATVDRTAIILGIGYDAVEKGNQLPLSDSHLDEIGVFLRKINESGDPPVDKEKPTVKELLEALSSQLQWRKSKVNELVKWLETKDDRMNEMTAFHERERARWEKLKHWVDETVPKMKQELKKAGERNQDLTDKTKKQAAEIARLKAEIERLHKGEGGSD